LDETDNIPFFLDRPTDALPIENGSSWGFWQDRDQEKGDDHICIFGYIFSQDEVFNKWDQIINPLSGWIHNHVDERIFTQESHIQCFRKSSGSIPYGSNIFSKSISQTFVNSGSKLGSITNLVMRFRDDRNGSYVNPNEGMKISLTIRPKQNQWNEHLAKSKRIIT
jgi:hypothetical protein